MCDSQASINALALNDMSDNAYGDLHHFAAMTVEVFGRADVFTLDKQSTYFYHWTR
jgi:hypothetical protein